MNVLRSVTMFLSFRDFALCFQRPILFQNCKTPIICFETMFEKISKVAWVRKFLPLA